MEEMHPNVEFSVVIPIYNAAPYLRGCLDSVLAQSFCDFELICVDDGSTDESAEILNEYKMIVNANGGSDRGKFVVVRQNNSGVSVARNRGLETATGKYVCFVDADDTVHADWLKKYAVKFKETGADVVRLQGAKTWALDGFPWKYSVRREIALKARFPIGVTMSEDGIYVARLAPFVRRIAVLNEMTYNYVVRAGTAMLRPLASAERLLFLKAVAELSEVERGVDSLILSRFCADAILAWLGRPKDLECKSEIRAEWKRLRRLKCTKINVIRPLLRVPYGLYCWTGLLWPTRVILGAIGSLAAIKRRI